LEDQSKAPLNTREKEYTSLQYQRFIDLRKQYIRYGKFKLLVIYHREYPEDISISIWNIQCMIQRAGLYYKPIKQAKINRKRQRAHKKKKITELKQRKVAGFLLCADTIVKYWKSKKRYILTAIDKHSKIAFARMYTTHSSYNARDFLNRLHYLLDGKIENIQTDNGSEFKKYFEKTCQQLNIPQYYSRLKTPKDNAVCERFNRTLKEEFIQLGNMTDDTVLFNRRLTEWLIEYNFKRPHQTLDYMPPINFSYKYHKVLPMYPSHTRY
jgi:transposase InsO family protein